MVVAARSLDKARMIRFVEHVGTLHSTDLGRTASHFYIKHSSIEVSVPPSCVSVPGNMGTRPYMYMLAYCLIPRQCGHETVPSRKYGMG